MTAALAFAALTAAWGYGLHRVRQHTREAPTPPPAAPRRPLVRLLPHTPTRPHPYDQDEAG